MSTQLVADRDRLIRKLKDELADANNKLRGSLAVNRNLIEATKRLETELADARRERDDRCAVLSRELAESREQADRERWRYQQEQGVWLETRDANQRLTRHNTDARRVVEGLVTAADGDACLKLETTNLRAIVYHLTEQNADNGGIGREALANQLGATVQRLMQIDAALRAAADWLKGVGE